MIGCAVLFLIHPTRSAAQGGTVSVPKAKPIFSLTLPEGWSLNGDSFDYMISAKDFVLTVQLNKMGEASDEAAAKKKAEGEALTFLAMGGDDKNPAQPPASEKQIAGRKGYAFNASYKSGDKTKTIQLFAFSVDGKTYYELVFQGPEDSMTANSDAFAGIVDSIKPTN